jgi:phage nucleotide-binding protein
MEIKKTNSKESLRITALIFGKSGAGKTTLASTLTGRTLIISAESGLLSLHNFDIDYVTVDSMVGFASILSEIEKGVEYENIFIDSLTEIAQILVAELQKKYPDRKDSFPLWQDYATYMRKIIKRLRDLQKYNVFVLALDKIETDELNNRFIIPDVNGKIASQLVQFFDEVFYLHVDKEGKRSLLTGSSEKIMVKDRSGRLKQFEEPNLQNIIRGIYV